MPRLLQEALRLGHATQEGRAHPQDEGREVASRQATNGVWAGLLEGVRPRRIGLNSGTTCSRSGRGCACNPGTELADAERLLLRAPEQGEIDPTGETDHGEVRRLAAFGDRLDDPR
jgi:hypothetical protein